MKRRAGIIVMGILLLGITGFAPVPFVGPGRANACGGGSSGGRDYVPQRRGPAGSTNVPNRGGICGWGSGSSGGGDYVPRQRGSTNGPSLTKEQAYDVLANHAKKLNPALEIGEIIDAGSFYEAEILADGKEVVERLAVDKQSGRLRTLE